MSNQQLTILLTSCDRYSDAWEPFFRLLKKYWPACNYPVILNSETKEFHSDDFQIETFCGGKNIAWSKRLKRCLKTINSEYVLLCLEDYFLQAPVDLDIFNAALQTMNENTNIGVIQFAIDIPTRYDDNIQINRYFSLVPKCLENKFHRIYCVLSLYRTEYLKKLLIASESPWEFEVYGSLRSEHYREEVYRENDNHPRCFTYYIQPKYGYAILRGKWLPNNKKLFEENGIEVDFSNLGMLDDSEYDMLIQTYHRGNKKVPRQHHTFIQKIRLPFTDPRLFFTICRTLLKRRFPFFPL